MSVFSSSGFRFSVLLLAVAAYSVQADFQPDRIYRLRQKVSLDAGWKFYRNTPAGTPSAAVYDDAAWQTVNVPHSAMYVPPTSAGEHSTMPGGAWTGVCWYRKSFTVPAGARTQKVFLEFEGAMQSADVYLNGARIGGHGASGYTGFTFDISSAVNRSGANVLAVRLDCTYSWNIPPGNVPGTGYGGEYPDFYLFSGLCRDVWLVCANNVYIPLYGQIITTPQVSSASATVRIRTAVRNDSTAAANCVVQSVVADAGGAIVAQASAGGSVAAGVSALFDCTTPAIANPGLWSPETPNLYRVFTKVFVNGVEVDDNVDRIGFRTLGWSTSGGFSLNGTRYVLRGVCAHQEFAWVGNALPNSRYFEEVRLVKNMGANAIRCAHYPRDPAYYDACDELGVICEPELPSWGGSVTLYNTIFWNRMDTCAQEMVKPAINHPSIIMWGIFNEAAASFTTQNTSLHNRIKSLDSTRFTAVVNNKSQSANWVTDIFGLNYDSFTPPGGTRYFNAEYHQGWLVHCYRGDTVTQTVTAGCATFLANCIRQSENDFSSEFWGTIAGRGWTWVQNQTGPALPCAGGHAWVFIDYWTAGNVGQVPMGMVDHYRIPKKVFYTFRSNWTGAAADTFVRGLTPTRVDLVADLSILNADSTDLTVVVASLRDAQGRCAHAARSVTLQLTGPVECFDTLTRTTIAGKIGWVLKSRNTAGVIRAIVTSSGLTPDTVIINSVTPDNSPLPFIWPPTGIADRGAGMLSEKSVAVFQNRGSVTVMFPCSSREKASVAILTLQGRRVRFCEVDGRNSAVLTTQSLGGGVYYLRVTVNGAAITKKIVVAP
ncbi:MAG: T9SS type A sorting domain-containing protein [Chitinispirillaceae bacterium]|nr:T9SS type A sorting domain-containing protein [Chitinispirillaceae bacterium]